MDLKITQMDIESAKKISNWTYDEPYSLYSMNEDVIEELLCGSYFSAYDKEQNLIGYFCFGDSAKVPYGNSIGAYDDETFLDLGLGMNPSQCGHGLGSKFLEQGIAFALSNFSNKKLRLTVATFNKRAIKVYKTLGFTKLCSFTRISDSSKTEFQVMILK